MRKRSSGRRAPKLGQHFLTGTWAAERLAEAVAVKEGETILEIGPGKGALTRELLKTGNPVVAIEKDEALVEELRRTFPREIASRQLRIITNDIRNVDPVRSGLTGSYVVAANIPYYITGEIIRQFLEANVQPRALALLVQKEVAERILGMRPLPAGRQGKESILSLSVKAYGTPRVVAKVSRGNFSPPPKVDSAILLIEGVSKRFFSGVNEKDFFAVIKSGFSSKRKFAISNLSARYAKDAALAAFDSCGIDRKARAEDIPLSAWREIAKSLSGRG